MPCPLSPLLTGLLDLVFAPECLACRGVIPTSSGDRLVCALCWARTRAIPHPRCSRCWMPMPQAAFGTDPQCRLCPELRPAVRAIRSAYLLDGPARALVHALKYRGWHSVARLMGTKMAAVEFPREVEREVRFVVPVPLSRTRARERGYNQATMLARSVAAAKGWKCVEDALSRGRSASSQTTLHPGERRANVAGVFRASAGAAERLALEHVLIVDDVWTTGATALACGEALLAAGARAFSVLTFARALPELERRAQRAELAGILP